MKNDILPFVHDCERESLFKKSLLCSSKIYLSSLLYFLDSNNAVFC